MTCTAAALHNATAREWERQAQTAEKAGLHSVAEACRAQAVRERRAARKARKAAAEQTAIRRHTATA